MKSKNITLREVVYSGMSEPEETKVIEAFVKIRYSKAAEKACVTFSPHGVSVEFELPATAPTPGQTAAIFSEEGYLLASGFIN